MRVLNTSDFIKRAKEVHGYKYDYSLVSYINIKTPVKIKLENEIYIQIPKNHLNGFKPENNKKITQEEFIQKSIKIYGNRYDYSLTNFINVRNKIKFIYNGEIYEQFAYAHLAGKYPKSSGFIESLGVRKIKKILDDNNIKYINEYKFDNCKYINALYFDFYLPHLNILIEYDGQQHFSPNDFFGGEKEFIKTIKRDRIKNEYALKNNIPLLRIGYLDNIDQMLDKMFQNQ